MSTIDPDMTNSSRARAQRTWVAAAIICLADRLGGFHPTDRGNLEIILLLLDHGADPNMHDSAYDATPAGWAEHHGQHEAQPLLEAREHPGAARRTVTAAFTAVSRGQFGELASLISPEIDWQGLPDEDAFVPRCRGRGEALERMRTGLLANREVSVSAFVEQGNRVLAHVHPAGDTPEVR